MSSNKYNLLASLVISVLALGCNGHTANDDATVSSDTASTAVLELTNYTWTVQYCQDPGDAPCNSYRNMQPGDEFQVRSVPGSKAARLILVKHKDLTRYEFKAAIVSLTGNKLVLNFDDTTGREKSCKQLTVNLIKEHGDSVKPGKTCREQLQASKLKMSEKEIIANCVHPSVMDWSIVSTAAKPPNCLSADGELRGFHAMSPPDPGDGTGTGRN